ncbi:MAG TPA: hypothetical protein VNA20_01930 [Frankiaceae bacterium]|nr:hypothetical protein [Frankiaceae bacterium]
MFRTALCVALATTALATAASAAAPACMNDPRGDVVVERTKVTVDAPHLDIVRVSVARTARELVATFHTAGAAPGNGTWSMFFQYDNRYEFYARTVRGDGLSWVVADPRGAAPGNYAYVVDKRQPRSPVRDLKGARADHSQPGAVRIHLPLKEVGPATPKRGATARVTWARARQAQVSSYTEYEDYAGCGFIY